MDDMAGRIARLKSLLPQLEEKLQSFSTAEGCKFRVLSNPESDNSISNPPKTLYILDSSFNPPSAAHFALAKSALTRPAASDVPPFRLLLLFSTHNADKAPSPASFVQRIAMMMLFAGDVTRALRAAGTSETDIAVDVGLTKEPYYTDKSIAIAQTLQYPSNPTHVHLVGFDTLIRFCNPKYYQSHSPPLSALAPFFSAGHRIRVTQRPYDPNDASSKEFGTAEEQTSYRKGLIEGGLEKDGFTKRWAEQIDMVPPEEGVGISSTRIRKAAKEGDWDLVGRLCTEDVAAWIKSESLYAEDDSGKKMMG